GAASRRTQRARAVAGVEEVRVGLVLEDGPPAALTGGRLDPGREGHPGGEVERGGIRDPDQAARAVEAERLAEAAQRGPAGAPQGRGVPLAGRVGGGGAGSLAEAPGADQARWRGGSGAGGGLGGTGVAAEIAGGIDGSHPISVGGRGGDGRIAVAVSGGRRDLREARAARALAALDPVAGNPDVVGRGRPAEIHLTGPGGRRG